MTRTRLTLIGIAVIGAMIALGVVLLSGFIGAQEAAEPSPGPLLATNRSILSVCVEGAGGFVPDQSDTARVDAALDDALDGFADTPPEFAERDTVLDCPGESQLADSPENLVADIRSQGGFRVEEPGPHRLFVFVVPSGSLGELAYAIGAAEYVLEGDVGRSVSTGLYITPDINEETLGAALLVSLGMQAPEPAPLSTEEQRARDCELGTPAPWCADYEN